MSEQQRQKKPHRLWLGHALLSDSHPHILSKPLWRLTVAELDKKVWVFGMSVGEFLDYVSRGEKTILIAAALSHGLRPWV